MSGESSKSARSNRFFPASGWLRGSTATIRSDASAVNTSCASTGGALVNPKSTSSRRIISTIRSASASLSTKLTPGCRAWKRTTARGNSVDETDGNAATTTRPTFMRETSCARVMTIPTSSKILSTTGKRSRPACVILTERVLRSNSRTPRTLSSSLICADRAGCVACRASAARVKLPSCPIAAKARSWRSDTFILIADITYPNNSFEL